MDYRLAPNNVAQAELGCFVRKNNPKEDRPLADPVLADFVSDAHHVGRETSLDLVDRGLNRPSADKSYRF
jgi:hypothetical protein